MTERNYYVLCDDNCRFPAMTKEQIYDAIAEATGMTPTPVDEAFITKIKEQNANHNMKFWHGTEAQFNALEETDSDTVYVIGTNKVKSVDALEAAVSELQEEVQPVERGGTGATDAEQAMKNLGVNDYIVERGKINGWEYRMWNSGKVEAWREYTTNIAISTTSGALYRSAGNTLMIPSSIFVGKPMIFGQARGNFCWMANITVAEAGSDFTFYLANGSSVAAGSRTMDFYMVGRWKEEE